MKTLKEEIKSLSAQQRELKDQRKTVNLVGARILPAAIAASDHLSNRYKLRIMYAAYAIIRGKDLETLESKAKTPINMTAVDKVVAQYGKVVHPGS